MDRKLINYLPLVLREVREYKALLEDGEQEMIASLWERIDAIFQEQFVWSATEYGVKRWETILHITPKKNQTLENRKAVILSYLTMELPYTVWMIRDAMDELCGTNGYKMELFHKEYRLFVLIHLEAIDCFSVVMDMLHRVVPANIMIESEIDYHKHGEIRLYNHKELTEYTHHHIRSVPLVKLCVNTWNKMESNTWDEVKNRTWCQIATEGLSVASI